MFDYADLIGKPFKYHGRGPDSYDCFGLLREIQRRMDGRLIPDQTSSEDGRIIETLIRLRLRMFERETEPFIGAHLLFRIKGKFSHVGVYIGDGRFLHTWEGSGGVCCEYLSDWQQRFEGGYYRYVGH